MIVSLGSGGAEGDGVRLIPSDQSAIERAAQEGLKQPPCELADSDLSAVNNSSTAVYTCQLLKPPVLAHDHKVNTPAFMCFQSLLFID